MPGISLLIDGDNYAHTHYAGTKGQSSGAEALMRLIADYRRYQPYVAVCFDSPGPTWRHRLYPAYKGQRGPKDEQLVADLAQAQEFCQRAGYCVPPVPGLEADDLLAITAESRLAEGSKVVILSRDKDCRQLLAAGQVTILKRATSWRGEYKYEYYTEADLLKETGLTPAQWPDYRAMAGDPSDNWPGAPGIGEKTAAAIVLWAGSLEAAMGSLWSLPVTLRQQTAMESFDWRLGLTLMRLGRSGQSEAEAVSSGVVAE